MAEHFSTETIDLGLETQIAGIDSVSSPQPPKPQKDLGTYNPDQELTPFGQWVSKPIWVPPKDSSKELAISILNRSGLFSSRE